MNQFTIVEKDGSKWLRPVLNPSDTDQLSRFFQNAGNGFEDLPYIGTRPEGTTVDESEVWTVVQYDVNGRWISNEELYRMGFKFRIAYTDAESHDRHISDDYPGIDYQPLFNHMSKNHGLTLTTSEMDEIIGLSTYILAKK